MPASLAQVPHFLASWHAAALAAWAIFTGMLICLGVRARGTDRGRRFDNSVGVFALLAYAGVNAYWLRRFAWESSLPLHVCDLAALCAPVALLWRWRVARALLYFWGLGLCTQGFVTPVTRDGPASGEFWMHWINHGAIVGAALYDLIVLGFRPGWRDWRSAVTLGLVYVALMLGLNIATGWNYGYVGSHTPETPTLVDRLGPWPMRVVWIALLGIAAMTALMIPWVIARRVGPRGDDRVE